MQSGVATCFLSTGVAALGIAAVFAPDVLFAWHPTLIFVWLFCGGNAIGFMQLGKVRQGHLPHALLHVLALLSLLASLAVMYQVKEDKGRPHWWSTEASWHAWAGAATALLFLFISLGAMAKIPVGSPAPAIAAAGPNHKAWARLVFAALLATIASGWYKIKAQDPLQCYGLFAALALLAWAAGCFRVPSLAHLRGAAKKSS